MALIKVAVNGTLGKMGQEVLRTLCREPDMEPVGGADALLEDGRLALPDGSGTIPVSRSLADIPGGAQVVVDFTNAEGAMSAVRAAAANGVNAVIGSSGIPDTGVREAEELAGKHGVGIVIAPNFALGAVLMIHLSRQAARFFDYADLTEIHHEAKIDAPSGTALAIARAVVESKGGPFTAPAAQKEVVPGTRGGTVDGVSIHSGRMPGRMAYHELVFGAPGQTLTLRHDQINRESFMPGVMMAVRHAVKSPGLTFGLDRIMGL